ncbi:alpha/beta hydrolase [Candidatus Peregrinibacteria bacterium]|nr:alpha/beta hydrolase [Candidatus Peregrinibacteria bacterium]
MGEKIKILVGFLVLVLLVGGGLFWKFGGIFGENCESAQFVGEYEGYLEAAGQKLIFEVEIVKGDEGKPFVAYSATPEQGAYDFVSNDEILSGCHLSYELAVTGLFVDGNIAVSAGSMTYEGTILQNGISGTFYLKKIVETGGFYEEEVSIESGDAVLAGTLSFPFVSKEEEDRKIQKKSQFSAVILLTGSGPQNRDENIFGFKVFKVLADYLNSIGFAVLRLDDRGVGKSTRGTVDITTMTFADDAFAALKYLQGRADIDTANIGFLGHSEGALASLLAKTSTLNLDVNLRPTGTPVMKIAFIILMAGPAVSGEQLNLWQMEYLARASGLDGENLNKALDSQRAILAAVKGEITWDEAKEKSKPLFLMQLGEAAITMSEQEITEYVDVAFEDTVAQAKLPWFKFFILNDPVKDIELLDVPVLVLFGGKDTQVPAAMNETFFEQAALRGGFKDYEIVTFPDANHLFQKAESGMVDEYAILDKQFVDGFLDKIGEFLAPFAREKEGRAEISYRVSEK